MDSLSLQDRATLNSLSLYLATRQTALRCALSLRTPLTTAQTSDLRVNYSNYFSSLISAVELLRESASLSIGFSALLESRFVFAENPSGKVNYSYVRELRNAIVHRGLDISAAAHIKSGIPFFIAPHAISNQSGAKSYPRLSFYVLGIVAKCESVIPCAIEQHLANIGVLERSPDPEQWVAETLSLIEQSEVIPEWVRGMTSGAVKMVKPRDVHRASLERLRSGMQPYLALPRCD